MKKLNYKEYYIYKAFSDNKSLSVLEMIRKNVKLFNYPGYDISKIMNDLTEKGYFTRTLKDNKYNYTISEKAIPRLEALEEEYQRIKQENVEKERIKREKALELEKKEKRKVALMKVACIGLVLFIIFMFIIISSIDL